MSLRPKPPTLANRLQDVADCWLLIKLAHSRQVFALALPKKNFEKPGKLEVWVLRCESWVLRTENCGLRTPKPTQVWQPLVAAADAAACRQGIDFFGLPPSSCWAFMCQLVNEFAGMWGFAIHIQPSGTHSWQTAYAALTYLLNFWHWNGILAAITGKCLNVLLSEMYLHLLHSSGLFVSPVCHFDLQSDIFWPHFSILMVVGNEKWQWKNDVAH